ncbi:flagellin [Eubacterium xylanophilum]|uniref:flagellin N-terminal helical domain-containing protein n=1 Tax=Eubacterium xylanophilum TaxID=39497 RepID=UPI00047D1437|nr:flagellin [Eubacterium xylanophilum]
MIVQHNIQSMNANRQLGIGSTALAKSTEKLASGYRINRAADDAAGLAISEKMRGQVRGLKRASDNAQDGISLIQTAEGMMDQQHAILQRARELSVQAANGTNTSDDIKAINLEVKQLSDEFTRIGASTTFNGKAINGDSSFSAGTTLQVGANKGDTITISWTAGEMSVDGIADQAAAQNAIKSLDDDIVKLSESRATLGAQQNRLEYTIKNDDNAAENMQAAESQIRDVDMADEMTTYSKNNIIQQAATSMLAHANQSTQGALSLLQ